MRKIVGYELIAKVKDVNRDIVEDKIIHEEVNN